MLSGGRPGMMAGLHVVPPPPPLEVNDLVTIDDRVRGYSWRGIVTNVSPAGLASIMPVDLVDNVPADGEPRRMMYDKETGLRDDPWADPAVTITYRAGKAWLVEHVELDGPEWERAKRAIAAVIDTQDRAREAS